MLLWISSSLLVALLGLGGVAFLTLLERKLLGLSQNRLGPNKVSVLGVLQPIADGAKLVFKEIFIVLMSQSFVFLLSPIMLMMVYLTLWVWVLPWGGSVLTLKYSSLLFFSLLGMSAYAVILTGWSSTSAFSKLGSLRGILQSLSFEVALILMFLVVLSLFKSFILKSEIIMELELVIVWGVIWSILSLMETNRAPFDLLEGESELISGFNLEMGSISFIYLFLSEYGMIMVMSLIFSISLTGALCQVSLVLMVILIFLRSCFPRMRYDIMMTLMWQAILPMAVSYYMLSLL